VALKLLSSEKEDDAQAGAGTGAGAGAANELRTTDSSLRNTWDGPQTHLQARVYDCWLPRKM